jgi:hypothetical protein
MALVWTLNVPVNCTRFGPDAGAGRMFSIEDMVWDSQRTPVSATAGASGVRDARLTQTPDVWIRAKSGRDGPVQNPSVQIWSPNPSLNLPKAHHFGEAGPLD